MVFLLFELYNFVEFVFSTFSKNVPNKTSLFQTFFNFVVIFLFHEKMNFFWENKLFNFRVFLKTLTPHHFSKFGIFHCFGHLFFFSIFPNFVFHVKLF